MAALLTGLPDESFTASSIKSHENAAKNSQFHLSSQSGWKPDIYDKHPYIQVNFGLLNQIEGLLISTDFPPNSDASIKLYFGTENLVLNPKPVLITMDESLFYRNLVPIIAQNVKLTFENWSPENGVRFSLFGCSAGQ